MNIVDILLKRYISLRTHKTVTSGLNQNSSWVNFKDFINFLISTLKTPFRLVSSHFSDKENVNIQQNFSKTPKIKVI